MNLVGYTATALSRNDIKDTPTNKNVVDFAIVELKDLQGNLVVMYDDAEGLNPETQKICDTDGQVTFFAEVGSYNLEINGRESRVSLGITAELLSEATTAAMSAVETAYREAVEAAIEDGLIRPLGNMFEIVEPEQVWEEDAEEHEADTPSLLSMAYCSHISVL